MKIRNLNLGEYVSRILARFVWRFSKRIFIFEFHVSKESVETRKIRSIRVP